MFESDQEQVERRQVDALERAADALERIARALEKQIYGATAEQVGEVADRMVADLRRRTPTDAVKRRQAQIETELFGNKSAADDRDP